VSLTARPVWCVRLYGQPDGGSGSRQEAGDTPPSDSATPSIFVLGGNGFVGSAICEVAVAAGVNVTSYNRSGRPAWFEKLGQADKEQHWVSKVDWKKGDIFEPDALQAAMAGSDAVISAIGAFGSHEFMLKMCGQATIEGVAAAKVVGSVKRFAFVSAHDYGWPVRKLVAGYYDGKFAAEEAITAEFGAAGVSLRSPAVFGVRKPGTSGPDMDIPLQLLGKPLRALASVLPSPLQSVPLVNLVAVPWIDVRDVATAAVRAATDTTICGPVLDAFDMAALGSEGAVRLRGAA